MQKGGEMIPSKIVVLDRLIKNISAVYQDEDQCINIEWHEAAYNEEAGTYIITIDTHPFASSPNFELAYQALKKLVEMPYPKELAPTSSEMDDYIQKYQQDAIALITSLDEDN